MNTRIRCILGEAMYRPGLAGVLLNPFYIARSGLWHAIARHAPRLGGIVLDIGCGTQPYRSLLRVDRYVGIDVSARADSSGRRPDLLYDGSCMPFPDRVFDGVLCSQVLEHVPDPQAFLSEVARLLKADGVLLLSVPFIWDEHEQPHDYRRYTSFGLPPLLEAAGFGIDVQEKTSADAGILFQLINAYLHNVTAALPRWCRTPLRLLLMAPLTCLGLLAARMLPANKDLFLDQIVIARRKS